MLFLFKEVNPIVYTVLLASNKTRNQNIKKSYGSLISGQKKATSKKKKKKWIKFRMLQAEFMRWQNIILETRKGTVGLPV